MAKADFKAQGEKLEVIPAVERVKKGYLDAREAMIKAMVKVSYRKKYKLAYNKETVQLEAAVINMYLEIRDKFKEKDKIRELDDVMTSRDKLTVDECYIYAKILLTKLEDLKLTKIEFKRGDPTRSIY